MQEKIASPTASWMIRGGIFFFADALAVVGDVGGMSADRLKKRGELRLVGLEGVGAGDSAVSSRKPSAGGVSKRQTQLHENARDSWERPQKKKAYCKKT